ncbi:MAG: hypothetical protein K9L59_01005 [Desulfobacterales bacterium]|nr:hypothetical protein [Desulfobacterales bacterium]
MKIQFDKEDAAMLKKYAHAEICFKSCAEYLDVFLKENVPWESAKSRALLTAAIIEYAKPFKKSNAVERIDDSIIPSEYEQVHKMMIKSRDKYAAHMDKHGLDNPEREFHRVQVIKRGAIIYIDIESPRIKRNSIEHIMRLSTILQEKAEYHRQKYLNKYKKKMFKCKGSINWELKIGDDFCGLAPIDPNQVTNIEWK